MKYYKLYFLFHKHHKIETKYILLVRQTYLIKSTVAQLLPAKSQVFQVHAFKSWGALIALFQLWGAVCIWNS